MCNAAPSANSEEETLPLALPVYGEPLVVGVGQVSPKEATAQYERILVAYFHSAEVE